MFVEYGELSTKMYEITKPVGCAINGDIDYYYQHLKKLKGKILEAGVGTGRMMIPFLEKGLDIEGVDLSEEMLAQCQVNMDKAGVKGAIYHGDLTNLQLQDKYEAVIMPTGSFCLLPRAIVKDVLSSIYQQLESGGRFIVDLELPSWFEKNEITVKEFPLTDDSGLLFTSTAQGIDWYQQKTAYVHRYELIVSGKVKETELSNFILYWYGIEEFAALLKEAGFSSVNYQVGYNQNPEASLLTFFGTK